MKIAVIDNIDSFVYNLVQYLGELGAEPIVFPNNTNLKKIKETQPEKLVISPGPKTPADAGISAKAIRELGKSIPTLGVCLGHQAVAYAFGSEITQAQRLMHGKTSMIKHEESPLYDGIPNPFEATRYHSLVIDPSTLPDCFQVTARTENDEEEIMGIKHKEYPILGVQFHPESILTSHGMKIVKNFLEGVKT